MSGTEARHVLARDDLQWGSVRLAGGAHHRRGGPCASQLAEPATGSPTGSPTEKGTRPLGHPLGHPLGADRPTGEPTGARLRDWGAHWAKSSPLGAATGKKAPTGQTHWATLGPLSGPLGAVHLGVPLCTWCADPSYISTCGKSE